MMREGEREAAYALPPPQLIPLLQIGNSHIENRDMQRKQKFQGYSSLDRALRHGVPTQRNLWNIDTGHTATRADFFPDAVLESSIGGELDIPMDPQNPG
jgi:hypothetical protein